MKQAAFLFPGQGSQYVGMGKAFWDQDTNARRRFEEANDLLGFDLQSLCLEGSVERLNQTQYAQTAIFTVSVMAYEHYTQRHEWQPAFMAGHSLGEYTAISCSGALPFADAIRLVRQRGILMEEASLNGSGIMVAVTGASQQELEEWCRKVSTSVQPVGIACHNSDQQCVLSGHPDAMRLVMDKLEQLGCKTYRLPVSGPFHSPLMQQAADKMRTLLDQTEFLPFQYPVLSNVTAEPYPRHKADIVEHLVRQMVQPVKWRDTMHYLQAQGIERVQELGPGKVLSRLFSRAIPAIQAFSYEQPSSPISSTSPKTSTTSPKTSASTISSTTSTISVQPIASKIEYCYMKAVVTPNRCELPDQQSATIFHLCAQLRLMLEQIDQGQLLPSLAQVEQAMELLETVLITKNATPEERNQALSNLR
ncbi:ACP S-malonyltransferase [Marinicrinis sediminis]|uniref:[acyl-carrier-protein] S-malonyltransferase n=1 Tax=Marinicrinis sediminis TaxID=1652465 RepID=A0ABW5R9Z0_9BACL